MDGSLGARGLGEMPGGWGREEKGPWSRTLPGAPTEAVEGCETPVSPGLLLAGCEPCQPAPFMPGLSFLGVWPRPAHLAQWCRGHRSISLCLLPGTWG